MKQTIIDSIETKFKIEDYENFLNKKISRKDLANLIGITEYSLIEYLKYKKLSTSPRIYFLSSIKHDIFDVIDTEEKAYLLGFYIADGCITGNRLCFTLSNDDIKHLKKIRDLISPNSKLNFQPSRISKQNIKSNALCKLAISSSKIVNRLNELGLGYKKTYLKKSIINTVPNNLMWHFIRGYFDGDGCISASLVKHIYKNKIYHNYNVNWTIISHDNCILKEIQQFIENNLNLKILLYPDNKGNYLVGTHSIKNLKPIFEALYNNSTIKLERKYEKFKNIIANTEVSSEITKGSETP